MSGNTSRVRGRNRELAYIQYLLDKDWAAQRTDGPCDIVAGRHGITLGVQMKSTLTPYSHFGPADRRVLREWCDLAGWIGVLVWWPKGVGIKKAQPIFQWDWPGEAPMPALIDETLLAA